ncbi:MAG: HD domain-containing protein [Lachnospiraceae bacterium]|nr:HD domain-containing protein [Lachnospiraceae bacterium]
METEILEILETAAITIGGFLIKKYVFLEPDMEPKKQRNFYMVSFLLIGVVFLAFGKDIASLAALFMIQLNICLSRDKHRLRSLVLLIPFLGIVNGLLLPVLFVPPYLLSLSTQEAFVYQFAAYGLLFVLLLIFYVKGRNWRNWFYENMRNRKLRKSEKYLLWMVGILMLFFSNVVAKQILEADGNAGAADKLYGQKFVLFVGISSISAFIMSVTIIVLIMQGNKRSFYHEQVSNMQSGLITFMAEVVENRDDNTGGHIKRTAEYVGCITKELRRQGTYNDILTDRYVSDMVVAAPLHDIGKIHIPDAVLNKPGKLTEEEFEVMKTHTTAGEELLTHAKAELGESGYLNTAVEMAAYHHEWWNGKGYPYGISGEEIPLCARIMAVADVFDALTSKRCYKNAMPLEKAYAIIKEESGTHFDPAVVEAFFAAVENMEGLQL